MIIRCIVIYIDKLSIDYISAEVKNSRGKVGKSSLQSANRIDLADENVATHGFEGGGTTFADL